MESENTPVHPNLNMDFQERFDPQEQNTFFADNRAMRPPVPGTVARGFLNDDTRFYQGRDEGGEFVPQVGELVPITSALLERGQERYEIYCSVCHGRSGDGQGIIMTGQYGYTPAPSFHQDRLREVADGYVYDVIANGIRNMPGYGHQVPVADRWAIVAHVRALQKSQYTRPEEVPASLRNRIEQGVSGNISGGRPSPSTTPADTSATDTSAQ